MFQQEVKKKGALILVVIESDSQPIFERQTMLIYLQKLNAFNRTISKKHITTSKFFLLSLKKLLQYFSEDHSEKHSIKSARNQVII